MQEIEQEKLAKCIEIANIPNQNSEDIDKLVEKVALKLKQPLDKIKNVRRIPGKKDQTTNIKVELQDETCQEKWISAAKIIKITVGDIQPTDRNNSNNVVYIREAMTKNNKTLLWQAKQELKNNLKFKYVWFKKGFVKVRKDDGSKIYTLRTLDDVYVLSK